MTACNCFQYITEPQTIKHLARMHATFGGKQSSRPKVMQPEMLSGVIQG